MSISTQPSPGELYAGILAIADHIGPRCRTDTRMAMLEAAAHAAQPSREKPLAPDATLRDHFAGQALMAIVGNDRLLGDFMKVSEVAGLRLGETVASAAYEFADSMLDARGAA